MDDLKGKKILIVDDERDIRDMIDSFLRKEGFTRIYHASGCAEALTVCTAIKPDIAILDVMLPDGDGFSLLTALRRVSDMPVLFLSARGEDEDRILGLGLGADDYIVKPFLPRELVLRIMAILRRVYSPPKKEQLHGLVEHTSSNRMFILLLRKNNFLSFSSGIASLILKAALSGMAVQNIHLQPKNTHCFLNFMRTGTES